MNSSPRSVVSARNFVQAMRKVTKTVILNLPKTIFILEYFLTTVSIVWKVDNIGQYICDGI